MTDVYVSLGSNINKADNIASGLKALTTHFGVLTTSSIYESEAIGFTGAPFYNLVACFDTEHDVQTVAKQLRQIEFAHGRPTNSQKFTPRTLDLDLILFGDLILTEGPLQLPRPDIERYAFVLMPLAEIAPNLIHPVLLRTYQELWQNMQTSLTSLPIRHPNLANS